MAEKLWFLRRLDLFEGLSDAEMARLAELMHDRSSRTGEDVVLQPASDRIYLVKSGRVSVLDGGVATAVLGPGQIFGTSALFGISKADKRVVALDDVVICDAPAGQFLSAMASDPRLAARVMTILARQIFDLERAVERTATEPLGQRLAELLLRLASRQAPHPEIRAIAESDLAKMIGASRESVSRLMAAWEREGIVHVRQRHIEILDEARLVQLSRSPSRTSG